jgi:hypothetical protein
MSNLIPLAYHYGYGYGGGWIDWLGHITISAVTHALIYSLIFWITHELTGVNDEILHPVSWCEVCGVAAAVH